MFLHEAVRQSASAPSHFEAISQKGVQITDGGVLANNPTEQILQLLDKEDIDTDEVVIINIGCG